MKKWILALAAITLTLGSQAYAGGRGGTEIGIASYGGGLGVVGALGIPVRIPALESSGLYTYGEVELGAGFTSDRTAFGGDVSIGLLLPLETGLDIYGSLGPSIGVRGDRNRFGLGGEVGLNIQINDTYVFIEGGAHAINSYFTVGLRF
ncbi:MAG: hypothetical protein ACX931_13295 [Saccharospirillum sp.]